MNLLLKSKRYDRIIEKYSFKEYLDRLNRYIEFDESYLQKPYTDSMSIPKKKYYGIIDGNFIAIREKTIYFNHGISYFITTYIRATEKKNHLKLNVKTELSTIAKVLYILLILFSFFILSPLLDAYSVMLDKILSIGVFIGINAVLFFFIPYQYEKNTKRFVEHFTGF